VKARNIVQQPNVEFSTMMRTRLLLTFLLAGAASGQEYSKNEFQALYLHGQMDSGLTRQDPALVGRFAPKRPHHGFAFSYVSNRTRISGLKLEVSWRRDDIRSAAGVGRRSISLAEGWI
jgi:hypothetical protein